MVQQKASFTQVVTLNLWQGDDVNG
ncbi:protein of unknown function [Pseudomonas mediterranea]